MVQGTATGALVGEKPFICASELCYSVLDKKFELAIKMLAKRRYAASLIYSENILWVSGGAEYHTITHKTVHASSEYIELGESSSGPELPVPLYRHAMVAVTKDLSLIVGGLARDLQSTDTSDIITDLSYYYNHTNDEWINGPALSSRRYSHAAFTLIDEATKEIIIIVAGGTDEVTAVNFEDSFLNVTGGTLSSTEILSNDIWTFGEHHVAKILSSIYDDFVHSLYHQDLTYL